MVPRWMETYGMSGIDPLLSDHDLEQITGRARSSWQKDRLSGRGPRFIRIGRLVRYRRSDLEAWLDAHARMSTSDPGAEANL